MQAIKRAKDKDRERGAINTLHNAHFSLVLKQKGKEKRERGREREGERENPQTSHPTSCSGCEEVSSLEDFIRITGPSEVSLLFQ